MVGLFVGVEVVVLIASGVVVFVAVSGSLSGWFVVVVDLVVYASCVAGVVTVAVQRL